MIKQENLIPQYANAYQRYKCQLKDIPNAVRHELNEYVINTFTALTRSGVRFDFIGEECECDKMNSIYNNTGVIAISTLHNESPLFIGEINLRFRAIHDYIHLTKGYGCDFIGEFQNYLEQSKTLSEQARTVLFSEIVLQASYYLHYGYFPTQKVVLIRDVPFLDYTPTEIDSIINYIV